MSVFNYFYDFQDCVEPIAGEPITYVVGSNTVITGGTFSLQSISNPNEIVCATFYSASTSTASTHTSLTEYTDCESCLSANTKVVTVSGCGETLGLTLLVDNRYDINDVLFVDIVYEDSGIEYIRTPMVITNILPFAYQTYVPKLLHYLPYDNCSQAIESKGVYYLLEDCSGGTQTIVLSHKPLYIYGLVVGLPFGETSCKRVVSNLSVGDYSDVSGVTTIIESVLIFSDCESCYDGLLSGEFDERFASISFGGETGDTFVNAIATQSDGKIIVGGSFSDIENPDSNYFNNIARFNVDGTIDYTFNSINEGSLLVSQDNYIFTNYNSDFNLDGDFTIEFWLKYTYFNSPNTGVISFYDENNNNGWVIKLIGKGEIEFEYSGTQLNFVTNLSPNEWHHIALVGENDVLNLYVDGFLDLASGAPLVDPIEVTNGTSLYIGTNYNRSTYFDGEITNIRITKSSVYNGNFTPKRSPLTLNQSALGNINPINSTDVVLLMNFRNQSSFTLDESSNNSIFYLSVPTIRPITFTPVPTSTLSVVFSGILQNDYYTVDFPDGYNLEMFGKQYDTVYLGSNSYITFDQPSSEGGLILPEEIPSRIGSSGLFISAYGNETSDNITQINRISTGITQEDNAFVVRVEGEITNRSQVTSPCNCVTFTNVSDLNSGINFYVGYKSCLSIYCSGSGSLGHDAYTPILSPQEFIKVCGRDWATIEGGCYPLTYFGGSPNSTFTEYLTITYDIDQFGEGVNCVNSQGNVVVVGPDLRCPSLDLPCYCFSLTLLNGSTGNVVYINCATGTQVPLDFSSPISICASEIFSYSSNVLWRGCSYFQ